MLQIVRYAEALGCMVWHDRATNFRRTCRRCGAPIGGPRNDPGYLDLHMVRGERQIFAELKKQGKGPTPAQDRWIAALARLPNVEVYVWQPSDFDTARQILN